MCAALPRPVCLVTAVLCWTGGAQRLGTQSDSCICLLLGKVFHLKVLD